MIGFSYQLYAKTVIDSSQKVTMKVWPKGKELRGTIQLNTFIACG